MQNKILLGVISIIVLSILLFNTNITANHHNHNHNHGHDHNHNHQNHNPLHECNTNDHNDSIQGNSLSFITDHFGDHHVHCGHNHKSDTLAEILIGVFKHAIMVTVFVLVMMLLIEYITVFSRGRWNRFFTRRVWLQILMAALLGFLPGCLGVYIVVSLYVHRLFSFAALVTVMIATSGDEAFVMLSVMPKTALLIFGLLAAIAIIAGFIVQFFMKDKTFMKDKNKHFQIHTYDPHCSIFDKSLFISQFKKIAFERALLLFGSFTFLVLLISGDLGLVVWSWEKIIFLIVTIISLVMFITVPDHFLQKHLWGHVIKKHFLKIFLWTFGAFLIIHLLIPYLDLGAWLETKLLYILLVAVIIGIIPESGPHIIFIFLYLDNLIPFSILLANSIVQDGHGALPLLAESRKSFILMKTVNLFFGFAVGLIGYFFGW